MKAIQDRIFWALLYIAVVFSAVSIFMEVQNIKSIRDRADLHRMQQQIIEALDRLEAQEVMAGYSIVHLAIMLIIVFAVVGIAVVAIRQTGVQIPAWVIMIFWIVAVALVAIWAIKFLVGMA